MMRVLGSCSRPGVESQKPAPSKQKASAAKLASVGASLLLMTAPALPAVANSYTGVVPPPRATQIPLSLSATEETAPSPSTSFPASPAAPSLRALAPRKSEHPVRDGVEWSLLGLAGVAWAVPRVRRVLGPPEGGALVGTRWQLDLSIGREKGTWMPPSWAASGRRLVIPIAVEFLEGGVCKPLGVGSFVQFDLEPGTWSVEGTTLRFNLESPTGVSRGDVSLPPGKLYFKTQCWGKVMSSSRGALLLLQRRAVVRQEWRSAGRFRAQELTVEPTMLPPASVKAGSDIVPYSVGMRDTW